ncbi:hypothetical protein [Halalkalibaculum sp. DA384]|uniref:tetratricopeptide repeat protein n=1 Tax=Halalkalibaculum sp. DA384 TaxID=3373606 RepID=UPI0037548DBC
MEGSDNRHTPVTLAILPFENLSTGSELEIFCKSFSLDLITELSRFRQFQIISYDSVRDMGLDQDSDEAKFHQLNTNFFVRGTFRHQDRQIRINIQLVDSRSLHLVWADRFSGDYEELISIQEHVLLELVSTLQLQLNRNLLASLRSKKRTHLKAYECWLYGLEELKKGSLESDLKAREYFRHAIEIDPEYARAYSGMSLTYFNEWSCQLWDRWELSQNGAFEWAQKAIELDEQDYVAAYVLGRVFLYQRAYETAEYFLRKSLRLNSNDPESLIQIAPCFLYLGYGKEAYRLYQKALRLNPAGDQTYFPIGALILYDLGRVEEAMSLIKRTRGNPYVDFKAYCAAAWYELGDQEKMNQCLEEFLQCYADVVNHGVKADLTEAFEWMSKINPYKEGTRLEQFWKHVTGETFRPQKPEMPTPVSHRINRMEESVDYWKFSFGGRTIQLSAVKGFSDIRRLVGCAGTPVHCTELMGTAVLSDGEEVIDEKAKSEYRREIENLREEIEEAEACHDFARAEAAQKEYEQLVEHLSGALGLRGNIRKAGNTVERARSAVTWRIRSAISKIEQEHPSLGKHLSNSIKTGTFCIYKPETQVDWEII